MKIQIKTKIFFKLGDPIRIDLALMYFY